MAARGSKYNQMGKQIARLAKNQTELAAALELTQQSVSGKLNGKIAVTINDMRVLGQKYNVPPVYFFSDMSIEDARSFQDMMDNIQRFASLPEVLSLISKMPTPVFGIVEHLVKSMDGLERFYMNAELPPDIKMKKSAYEWLTSPMEEAQA